MFDLAEGLLDRIEVWRVGRQVFVEHRLQSAPTERTIRALWDAIGPLLRFLTGRMRELLQGNRIRIKQDVPQTSAG